MPSRARQQGRAVELEGYRTGRLPETVSRPPIPVILRAVAGSTHRETPRRGWVLRLRFAAQN